MFSYLFLLSFFDSTLLALEFPTVAALAEILPLVNRSMAPFDLWDPVLWPLFDCFNSPGRWAS
jgi:hypothetical protein